jgi:hypothetical protein
MGHLACSAPLRTPVAQLQPLQHRARRPCPAQRNTGECDEVERRVSGVLEACQARCRWWSHENFGECSLRAAEGQLRYSCPHHVPCAAFRRPRKPRSRRQMSGPAAGQLNRARQRAAGRDRLTEPRRSPGTAPRPPTAWVEYRLLGRASVRSGGVAGRRGTAIRAMLAELLKHVQHRDMSCEPNGTRYIVLAIGRVCDGPMSFRGGERISNGTWSVPAAWRC